MRNACSGIDTTLAWDVYKSHYIYIYMYHSLCGKLQDRGHDWLEDNSGWSRLEHQDAFYWCCSPKDVIVLAWTCWRRQKHTRRTCTGAGCHAVPLAWRLVRRWCAPKNGHLTLRNTVTCKFHPDLVDRCGQHVKSGDYFPPSLPLSPSHFSPVWPVFVALEGNSVGTNFLQGVLDDDGPLGLICGHGNGPERVLLHPAIARPKEQRIAVVHSEAHRRRSKLQHSQGMVIRKWKAEWVGENCKDMARTWQGHDKDMARTWQGHGKDMARTWQGHGKDMYDMYVIDRIWL